MLLLACCLLFLLLFFSAASLSRSQTATVGSSAVSAIDAISLPPFKAFQVFCGKLFIMAKVLFFFFYIGKVFKRVYFCFSYTELFYLSLYET